MRQEKWSHIANEFETSLFPAFSMADAIYLDLKKSLRHPAYILLVIENNATTYYARTKNWKYIHDILVSRVEKNLGYIDNLMSSIDKHADRQIKYLKDISIKNKSNKGLNTIYQTYIKMNQQLYSFGIQMPLLDYQDTTYLTESTRSILKKYDSQNKFSFITTPTKETYNKKQEVDLYKLYYVIEKDAKLKNILKNKTSRQFVHYIKDKKHNIYKKLKNHTNKYAWVNYVYEGPAADIYYFVEALKDLRKNNFRADNYLKKLELVEKKIYQTQKEFEQENNLSKKEKDVLRLTRDFIFYKPYRRELQSWSYFLMEPVLKEIALRLNLTIGQVRMMLPEDIERGLLKGKINIKLINQRRKLVVYYYDKDRVCLTGSEARQYIKTNIIRPKKINKNIKKIIGTTAYEGKVRGVIRMINTSSDIKKMKSGDILLASATSPNLMPAIRQAKAIITDEGGLTCHAAIVSRELKIPCVIGTKIATKVLNDGDKVEVDALRGIIKKLN